MKVELDLNKINAAERIWLWRRRHQSTNGRTTGRGGSRMSIGEAAALLALPLDIYSDAEAGNDTASVLAAIREAGGTLTHVTRAELCALARRRSGENVDTLCAALGGISRPTFFVRENEAHPELVALWQARGFSF